MIGKRILITGLNPYVGYTGICLYFIACNNMYAIRINQSLTVYLKDGEFIAWQ